MRILRTRWRVAGMLTVLALVAPATRTSANEVTVKNDDITDGSSATIQAGFDAGESAAAWLTSPCDGTIVAVQVYWRSQSGGQPPSLEDNITIYSAGTFPVPGTILAFLEGPVMTDGALNEFRYLDEAQTIPIDVPVTTGQVFVVSFRFANDPNPANGPSVVTDGAPGPPPDCQSGKNAIDAIGLGWQDACALGVSGDFMIRAVVDCQEPTGACCLVSGQCTPSVTASQCATAGGTYQGDGSTCGGVSCPILIGACCKPDGTCENGLTSSQCAAMSGTYQGNNTNCGSVTCPQPQQACCNATTGFCGMADPNDCTGLGGVPQGPGTTCVGPSNNECPTGACCLPDGNCSVITPAQCETANGAYQGTGVTCGQVSCPQPQGACCLTSGGCSITGQSLCEGLGNTWAGIDTDCADLNGNTQADACEQCPVAPDGDMNGSGTTEGRDIGIFVKAIMNESVDPTDVCRGDFSSSFVVDPDDIPGMIAALLSP